MPLYVRLENPYRETNAELKRQLKKGGAAARESYKNRLISEGHDGVLIVDPTTNEVTEVIAFDSKAVKPIENKDNWVNEIEALYDQNYL